MESSDGWPTPEEAAVALAEAETSRTMLARGVVLPSLLDAAIGAAITVQIATTALGLADIGGWAGWLLPSGVVVFEPTIDGRRGHLDHGGCLASIACVA